MDGSVDACEDDGVVDRYQTKITKYYDHDFDWEDLRMTCKRAVDRCMMDCWMTSDIMILIGKSCEWHVSVLLIQAWWIVWMTAWTSHFGILLRVIHVGQEALDAIPHLPIEEKQRALQIKPGGAWDDFYIMHSKSRSKFFKFRSYLTVEFPELMEQTDPPRQLLEIGCGYGASLACILQRNPVIRCHACDLSTSALTQLEVNEMRLMKARKGIRTWLVSLFCLCIALLQHRITCDSTMRWKHWLDSVHFKTTLPPMICHCIYGPHRWIWYWWPLCCPQFNLSIITRSCRKRGWR